MKEFRISNGLIVEGDGTYDQTVLNVTGSQGQLFSVTDRLDGDIFSVSGISGVPILNVNSNGDVTISTLQTSTSESVVVETGGVLAKRDMTDITTAGLWVEGTGLIYPKDIGNHVGIGLVAPTSVLDIKADTGTANTFQIRHSSGDIGLSVNQSTNWADSTSGVIFKMFDGASSTQTIHLDSRSSATYKSYFNAGNFGFGIADPQFLVHLHAESTPYLHFTNNGSGTTSTDGMSIGLSGASGLVWVRDNYYLRFGTNALERMRINANGYISMGIGAASASYPLVVNIPAGNRARFDYTTTGVYMDFVDYTTGTFAYSNTIGIFGAGKNFLHMSSSGKSQKFVVHNGTTYLPGMTLSKDAKLTVHGDLDVQDDAVISGFTNATLFSTENTAYRTYNPKGGLSMLATTAVTGAIVIKLPPYAGNSYTSFWVDVFNYTGGNSFSLYFGAYYYKSGTVAFYPRGNGILATEDWHDYQIQYYIDDVEEQAIIVIGTVTSEWYSPMVTVRDVSQRLYNYLREGWEISLSTDLSAYRLQTTIPNSFIYSDYNRMINAPTIPSEANDATITLTAGNGLITGGAFTTNQAANETITFTLGTPGTLTNSSTNSASASSHTHAITNYALTSTTTNQLTITGASRVLGVAGSLAIKTATVANAGTALATGDQIYDFVIGLGYSTTVGTVTSVGTSGAILGGTFTDSGTISHSDATGYKHIPTAGAATQILRWSASGTAVWYTPPWTENTGTITSVSSGAGMNFTNVSSGGVTITMGTPGTLTSSTSNSASGTTHTHAVTFPAPPDVYWERVNSKWLRPKTTTDFVYLQATGRNDTTSQHITRQLGSISFSQQYAYRELRIATGTTSTTVLNGVFKIRVTSDSGSVATTSYLEKIIYIATYYSGTDSTVYAQDSYYTSKLRSYHSRITDFYVDGANNEIVLQIWSTYNGSRSFNIEIDYVGKNAHNFLNATLGSQINGVIGDLPVTEYQGTSPNSEFKIAKTLTTAGDFLTISDDDLVGQRTAEEVLSDIGASATTHTHTLQAVTDAGHTTTTEVRLDGGFGINQATGADVSIIKSLDTTSTPLRLVISNSSTGFTAQNNFILSNSNSTVGNVSKFSFNQSATSTTTQAVVAAKFTSRTGNGTADLYFITRNAAGSWAEHLKLQSEGLHELNGMLGINKTPGYDLDIAGDSYVTGDSYVMGDIGIGTTTPSTTLTIRRDNGDFINLFPTTAAVDVPEATISFRYLYNGTSNTYYYPFTFKKNDSSTSTGCVTIFANKPDGAVSKEAMRIDIDGNLGIGTNSPNDILEVAGAIRLSSNTDWSGGTGPRFYKSDTHGLGIVGATGTTWDLAVSSVEGQGLINIPTGTSDILLAKGGGNVGIGSAIISPSYQLDVAGTFRVTETTLLQGNVTAQAKVDITGITTFNSVKVDYVSTILRRMSNIANHAFGSTIPVGTMVIYPNLASTAAMLKFKISGKSYDNSWDLTFSSYLSTSNWVRPSEVTVVGDAPFTADQVRLSFDFVTGNHYILLGSTTTSWTNYMTVFIDVEESWGATRTSLTGWTIEVTTTEPAATSTVTPSVSFFGGKTTIRTNLTLKNLVKGTADYDQFLVSDSGLVKYRTGAEVLSDIGASATTHTHTLQEVTNAGNTTTNDIESTAQVKATGGFVARDSANADAATMAYNDTTETLDFTFA